MSKKAYSKDLRERVINHIKSGNTQINTSKTFNISTSTVSRWWIIYNRENSDKEEERNISYFRSLLRCDGKKHGSWFKKKRIFFILTVWSKDLADSPKNLILGEFIVRRKDI